MMSDLTEEEFKILCELVFLGNWLINSVRPPDTIIEKYDLLALKIQKLHSNLLSPQEKRAFDKDPYPFYLETLGLDVFIEDYDNEVLAEE